MIRAETRDSTPPLNTSATGLEPFAALAAAVHPDWHQAIVRLASSTERLSEKLGLLINEPGSVRENAGKVVEMLIANLDLIAGNVDLEECDEDGEGEDAEPSLDSFDRIDRPEQILAHEQRRVDRPWRRPGAGRLRR